MVGKLMRQQLENHVGEHDSLPIAKVTSNEQFARLDRLEELMFGPLGPEQIQRANRLAVSIARDAPDGNIASLAMRLLSAIYDLHASATLRDDDEARLALTRLRWAVEACEQSTA